MNKEIKQIVMRFRRKAIQDGFILERIFKMRTQSGQEFYKARLVHPDTKKKDFLIFHSDNGTWKPTAPEFGIEGYPLFGRQHLAEDLLKPVYLVEGENKVLALLKLGIQAVTSGSSDSVMKTDITPLLGRNIILWRDNDDAGLKWQKNWLERLSLIAVEIQSIDVLVLSLPEKGDVIDWLKAHSSAKAEDISNLKKDSFKPTSNPSNNINISSNDPEILPLMRPLTKSQPFPVEALGNVIAPAVKIVQESVQAPLALISQSFLSSAMLVAQALADISVDGRQFPISEYFVTVGVTGERKTAVDRLALMAHRAVQKELLLRYDNEMLSFEAENENFRKNPKGKSTKEQSYEEIELFGERAKPTPPMFQLIICEEPTFDGFIKLLCRNRPSVGIFSDEGGKFLSGYSMKEEERARTIAGFNNLWDGREITRVRAGEDQPIVLYDRRVTIHLMAQPIVADKLFSSPEANGQGLLPRCLISSPESTVGTRLYKEFDPTTSDELKIFNLRITELYEHQSSLNSSLRKGVTPYILSLTPEAKSEYIKFHDQVEKRTALNGDLRDIQGFASKAAEHSLRIAGALTCFHHPVAKHIEIDWINRAIQLMDYYLSETLRIYQSGILSPDIKAAQATLSWFMQNKIETISLPQLYQNGPTIVRNAEMARKIMKILENHGRASRIEAQINSQSRRKEEKWKINFLPSEK